MKRTTTFFILMMLLLAGCGQRLEGTPPQPPLAEAANEPVALEATADPETTDSAEATAVPEVINPAWETAVTACAATERDEVCQNGQTTALAQVTQVAWGAAEGDEPLLRLAADLDEDEGALTLVGLGVGQIVELTTLVVDETAVPIPFATIDEETATEEHDLADVLEPAPQQITFFSEPGTAELPSGLLLAAPPSALFTSLGLNGAQVTLVGSAWAEAAPGGSLTLTVLSGDVMMSVGGDTAVATTGSQITVSISPSGLATGAPQTAEAPAAPTIAPLTKLAESVRPKTSTSNSGGVEEDLLTPLVPPENSSETTNSGPDDLLTPLVPPTFYYRKFLRSYQRCLSDRPDVARYVYNTAYWLRRIEDIGLVREALGDAVMARLQDMARQCATFDVDFGSTMTVSSSEVTFAAELKAENVHVQFTPGGGPFQGDVQTLQYLSLTESGMDAPACTLSITHPDGTLRIDDGLLAIQENGLRLRLNILPDVPQESFVYTCAGVSTQPSAPFNWFPLFMGLYADIFSQKGFTISDWHYVGGELMAEAILDRTMTLDGATLEATTYLVLVHNP
ncbi:MAG: hypothetical protein IPM53_08970 [Anaerolineaceae bacterium]|nr:hypothetical protein [Anaerolineaceae bacterium]